MNRSSTIVVAVVVLLAVQRSSDDALKKTSFATPRGTILRYTFKLEKMIGQEK